MKLKAQVVREGRHPSEVVIEVATLDGRESLVVNSSALVNDSLEVGYPVNQNENRYLVELPHETDSGAWRIWVPESELKD